MNVSVVVLLVVVELIQLLVGGLPSKKRTKLQPNMDATNLRTTIVVLTISFQSWTLNFVPSTTTSGSSCRFMHMKFSLVSLLLAWANSVFSLPWASSSLVLFSIRPPKRSTFGRRSRQKQTTRAPTTVGRDIPSREFVGFSYDICTHHEPPEWSSHNDEEVARPQSNIVAAFLRKVYGRLSAACRIVRAVHVVQKRHKRYRYLRG